MSSFASKLALAVLLPIFAMGPLFYPGPIQTHHGFIVEWNSLALRSQPSLDWLPTIATQFDPVRGQGLLVYSLTALTPLPPNSALKLWVGLAMIAASVGMFLWLRSWLGDNGALVAAQLYVYLPHALATSYVRGAWGESLFWGFLPGAILVTTYLVTHPRWLLLLPAIVAWLVLAFSQLGLTWWACTLLICLMVVVHPREMLKPAVAALIGTILATIFLLSIPGTIGFIPTPNDTYSILTETNHVLTAALPYPLIERHLLYPSQLFSAFWGFGVSQPGWQDGLSLQIGLALIGLNLISLYLWQTSDGPVSRTDRRLIFFASTGILLSIAQLVIAHSFWQLPAVASSLTYPWQLMGFVGLCGAVLGGAILWIEPEQDNLPTFAALLLLTLLSSYRYLEPQFYDQARPVRVEMSPPIATLDEQALLLLSAEFGVTTSGNAAGLRRDTIQIPLAVNGPLQPHDQLWVDALWQTTRPLRQDWKIFIHLVDPHETIIAQFDGYPTQPTSAWPPGALIADRYPLILPADLPPGPYHVYLGLYDEATFARMAVPDDPNGRVMLVVE